MDVQNLAIFHTGVSSRALQQETEAAAVVERRPERAEHVARYALHLRTREQQSEEFTSEVAGVWQSLPQQGGVNLDLPFREVDGREDVPLFFKRLL